MLLLYAHTYMTFFSGSNHNHPLTPENASTPHCSWNAKYLLLTEFEGRTVNYGPRFSPSIYGPSAKRAGHKSKGKNKGP